MRGSEEWDALVARANAAFDALTPEQQAEHRRQQRESWARSMAPCEHGIADWEDCPDCRTNANQKDAEGRIIAETLQRGE